MTGAARGHHSYLTDRINGFLIKQFIYILGAADRYVISDTDHWTVIYSGQGSQQGYNSKDNHIQYNRYMVVPFRHVSKKGKINSKSKFSFCPKVAKRHMRNDLER